MIPYLYRPITSTKGTILKCCGIATPNSRAIVQSKADGIEKIGEDGGLLTNGFVLETPFYFGDQIPKMRDDQVRKVARVHHITGASIGDCIGALISEEWDEDDAVIDLRAEAGAQ